MSLTTLLISAPRARGVAALAALTVAAIAVPARAQDPNAPVAAPPIVAPPPPDAKTPVPSGFVAPGPPAPPAPPSLLKELPIAAFIATGGTAILGAVLDVFGANAANDLKNPADHTTPQATHDLVVKARVGEAVSGVAFVATGATAIWGAINTVRAVMKISKYKSSLGVDVTPAPVSSGAGLFAIGSF